MRLRFARSNIGRRGDHIKTIRSTSSKRSSICKPTWWSCCSQCLRVRITDFEIMKTYRDFPGNVLNGTIGKQMVDTLVESTSNVEVQQCLLSYFSTFHPFYFHVSQHFLNTFIFSFLDSCALKSFLFLPTLSLKSDWSQIKGGCLQLILNYFKLFLLLPGEEVRNLRPVHPLSTHTQTNISHPPIYPNLYNISPSTLCQPAHRPIYPVSTLCPPFVNPHKDQCILCQPQTHLSWFSVKHASI